MFFLKQTIHFDSSDLLSFPQDECCNCGARKNLGTLSVDIPRRVSIGIITNIYHLNCPLPFCPECAKTAKRKWGASFADRIVEFVLSFIVLLFLGASVFGNAAKYFALIGSVSVVLIRISLARPKGNQTSYFVPVRLFRLRRKMLRNEIKSIGLLFTNDSYAQKFARKNAKSIESGFISIKSRRQGEWLGWQRDFK
ncbi:MAG: hypothetical protein LBF93_13030 [Zoogloeaceae bacterium]|jgi:hypothetical protein|nr:hypothetical protein [Zoogloeaceae bacterium]